MIDIVQFTQKLVSLKMTPNQFYFCYLLHNDRFPELYQYVEKVGTFDRKDIEDLKKRGFVRLEGKEGTSDGYKVTDKFTKNFLANSYELAKTFFDAYPSFGSIDGRPISLKAISPDKFYEQYNLITGKQLRVHERIMTALEKAKKMGLVNMKIDKWLDTRQWELIDKELKYVSKPSDREFTAD